MPQNNIKELIETTLYTGGLASFGGLAYYVYLILNGEKFTWVRFIAHMIIAFYIGDLVSHFMPNSLDDGIKHGLISMSGASSFHIMKILESKGASLILQKIGISDNNKK